MSAVVRTRWSLAELLVMGFLPDAEVQRGGIVEPDCRARAEARYAEFLTRNPRPVTAPPPPPLPRPPPRPPPPPPPGSVSHVRRVRYRQGLDEETARRTPRPLVLDACCVCLTRTKDHACVPCFHLSVCQTCASRLNECPLCRRTTTRFQRIYLS